MNKLKKFKLGYLKVILEESKDDRVNTFVNSWISDVEKEYEDENDFLKLLFDRKKQSTDEFYKSYIVNKERIQCLEDFVEKIYKEKNGDLDNSSMGLLMSLDVWMREIKEDNESKLTSFKYFLDGSLK